MSPRLPAAPRFPTHSHLLRTTALVSLLSTLTAMHPGQAYATYTLDNASPGTSSLRAMSGPWDASSQIWYNDVSDQWEALANGGTAILGRKASGLSSVTLTIDNNSYDSNNVATPADIRVDVIQANENGYTLSGGVLKDTGSGLRFTTDDPSSPVSIAVSSTLDAAVIVDDGVTLNFSGATGATGSQNVLAGGRLNTTTSATTQGAMTVDGTAEIGGTHTGAVENNGTFVLTGTINAAAPTDKVVNNASFTQQGTSTVAAAVDNAAGANYTMTGGALNGAVTNLGEFWHNAGTITGTFENDGTFRLNGGRLTGDLNNTGDVVQIGGSVIDGNVTTAAPSGDEYLLRGGQITGNVDNAGLMAAYGSIDGALTNQAAGKLTVNANRTLTVGGAFTNQGTTTLEDGSTVTGTITNAVNATLEFDDATVSGAVTTNGTIYVLSDGSEITGDLGIGSAGRVQLQGNSNATLTVGGRLTQTGYIDTDGSGNLTIVADEILLRNASRVEGNGAVRMRGTEVVQGSKVFTQDEGLRDGLIDGGILNEATGTVKLLTGVDVDGNGYAIANSGRLELEGANASLYNLQSLSNTGADARLIVSTGSELYTDALTNTGRITNAGTIGVSGATQLLDNQTGGKVTNTGLIQADIDNAAGATLISSNLIDGDVDNDGTAYLAGTITGSLDNSSADVTLTGSLNVASLTNSGAGNIRVNRGQTLSSAGQVTNSATLTVAGALAGNVGNTGTLTSDGTITGNVTNDGTATLAGRISGDLLNHTANVTLTDDLRVGRLRNSGSAAQMTVAAGQTLTTDSAGSNSGRLVVNGELRGSLTNTGTLTNSGTITGNVASSAGTLTSTGTIGGNLDNDSTANLAGTITGELDNSADDLTLTGNLDVGSLKNSATDAAITVGANQTLTSNGAVSNAGALTVALDGTLTADGNVTNSGTMTVTGDASTTGKVTNTGRLDVAGTLDAAGDLDNSDIMSVAGTAAIGGDVGNDGTLEVSGTLTSAGAVQNDGTLTVAGALTATDGLTNDGTINLTGTITGAVDNTAGHELNMTSGTITGNVVNDGQTNLRGNSTITGDLTNTGTMTAMGGATTLNVTGGTFLNDGILNTRPSSTLTITADALEFGVHSQVDASRVFLSGDIINNGILTYDEDASLNNGGLINKSSGKVIVSAGLDAQGKNVTNAGEFLVTRDSNSTGNLHNVELLQNSGSFTIDRNGQVSATTIQNNSGTLTVAGSLTGAVSNRTDGNVVLDDGIVNGAVENYGDLTGTGTINGALTNRKTADLGGTVGNTVNSGVLGTNGDLTLGTLLNTGTVKIDAGDSLTTTGAVDNRRKLEIAGTLTSGLQNAVDASTVLSGDGTIQGAVINDGRLSGQGNITGALTNNGSVQLAGSLGAVTNTKSLQTAGDLKIASLTNTGTTSVRAGDNLTMGTTLQNQKTLEVAGTLTGSVTNHPASTLDVNGGLVTGSVTNVAGSSTTLNSGTVQGKLFNSGTLIANGDSTIGGTLVNSATARVLSGQKLTAGGVENGHMLTVAGTLDSDVENINIGTVTLQSGSILGDVTNAGTLTGNGTVSGRVTNTGEVNSQGVLNIGLLSNNKTVNVTAGSTLASDNAVRNSAALNVAGTLKGAVSNGPRGTVTLQSGTITGAVSNSGTMTGLGTLAGTLTNTGIANLAGSARAVVNSGTLTLLDTGTLDVVSLTNEAAGRVTVDRGETLNAASRVLNKGRLQLAGQLNGDVNNTGTLRLDAGRITGAVVNSGTLNAAGTISGTVSNRGTLNTSGTLSVKGLTNTGAVAIGTDETLVSTTAVVNEKTLSVAGSLRADLNNQSGATTALNGGTVTGQVQNRGTLAGSGTIDGKLTTRMGSTTTMGGKVNGDLVNLGGVIRPEADLQVEGYIYNSASSKLVLSQAAATTAALTAPGSFTVDKGVTVSATRDIVNGPNAYMNVAGTLNGKVINRGIYNQTGTLSYTLETWGTASVGGLVRGDLEYNAGKLDLKDGVRITGQLILKNDYTVADGTRIDANQTVVASTLRLGGTLDGAVANLGTVKMTDNAAKVTGNFANQSGTIDLRDGDTRDVLTVGGLSGAGKAIMDISTGDRLTSDRIVVDGGRATGSLHFALDSQDQVAGSTIGQRVTLLDVDESFGAGNDITYTYDELSAANERIVYSIDQASNHGDLTLVSQVNPAIGAMFANVTLVQSLIGSVINRPTSPYVTGLVVDSTDKPCGVGGWGRATGGTADVEGKTDNQVSVLNNKVSASYYGMQGGMDLACFDDRFGGWDMAFGALGGVNIGDSRQPIYAINGRDSQATTGALASVTTTDFQQRYLGVYATASKDRWVADLQLRMEKTDFELKNTPASASSAGLGISDPDFSSDGYTLSGSVSYSMPIATSGWNLTPTVGFAWSKYSTDSISFSDGFWMEFDDSDRKIGFVGATVSKAFIRMEENAAIQTFATATYYKDFADAAVSRLYNDELDGYETQVMTSDNLKSYTELSVGANYVKVLNPGHAGGARQFSTSARIDGRFGKNIDSVGVTGQIRWQF